MLKKAGSSVFKKQTEMFKVSSKIAIKKNTEKISHSEFIPKNIPFEDNKSLVEQVAIGINTQVPILLIGETGTGKTSLIRHLAYNTNNAFVRVNHNGGTSIEDLLGRWLIDETGKTIWSDGILIQAMRHGYWFLADEINAASAEINFVYHSLLDDDGRIVLAEKGQEVVIPHPNFRFFGAMNPPAEYAGTKELNKALLSRFMVCKVDFPAPKVEAGILVSRCNIPIEVAEKMVRFAGQIRLAHGKGQYRFVLSTRDLLMWATVFNFYGKYGQSAETTIMNKVPDDDFEAIKDMMGLNFKTLDSATAPDMTETTTQPQTETPFSTF